ncbi:MAG: 50S ribosomal protein L18e [Nitrososphaerales archaeon]
MQSNPVLNEAILNLRHAYKKSRAPIWLKLQEILERPGSNVEVNLNKLSKYTDDGDVVIVPGKVLGTGTMEHKITLCVYSLSESAAKKVTAAGCKIINIKEFVEKFPQGSKVKIIV